MRLLRRKWRGTTCCTSSRSKICNMGRGLSCTFVAQKYQNARHTEKAVRRLFAYKSHATFFGRAAGAKAHSFGELKFPSSQTLLARNGAITASPSVAGCCGHLISAAILKIIYTRANLQTCLAQWPATDGASIVLFNGAGFIGITIANRCVIKITPSTYPSPLRGAPLQGSNCLQL